MTQYILKQQPYGVPFDIMFLAKYKVVFCPFLHSARGSGAEYLQHATNTTALLEYHCNNGYPRVSLQNIERCIRYFNNLTTNDIIYVPHKSYSNTADDTLSYRLRIVGPASHETINGFSALFHKVEILDANCQVYADGSPVNRGPSIVLKHKQ